MGVLNEVSRGRKFLIILGLIFIVSAFASCDNEEEEQIKKEWIENEVQNLIIAHRNTRMKECKMGIIKKAENAVDSILSGMDLFNDIVDEKIPAKPVKPKFVPLDSTAMQNHKVERVLKQF